MQEQSRLHREGLEADEDNNSGDGVPPFINDIQEEPVAATFADLSEVPEISLENQTVDISEPSTTEVESAVGDPTAGIAGGTTRPRTIQVHSFELCDPQNLLTPTRPSWITALANVIQDPSRVARNGLTEDAFNCLRGWVYPNPQLFLMSEQRIPYGVAWLLTRDRWIGAIAMGSNDLVKRKAPKTATFRVHFRNLVGTYLHALNDVGPKRIAEMEEGEVAQPTKDLHNKRHARAKGKKRAEVVEETFAFLGELSEYLPRHLKYSGVDVIKGNNIELSHDLLRMMIWELCELNFRVEVQVLDAFMATKQWREDGSGRNELIGRLFPRGDRRPALPFIPECASFGKVLEPAVLPQVLQETHIGSRKVQKRRKELLANRIAYNKTLDNLTQGEVVVGLLRFRDLLSSWPGWVNDGLLKGPILSISKEELQKAEEHTFSFYAQKFFDSFGRAPTIPRDMPAKLSRWISL